MSVIWAWPSDDNWPCKKSNQNRSARVPAGGGQHVWHTSRTHSYWTRRNFIVCAISVIDINLAVAIRYATVGVRPAARRCVDDAMRLSPNVGHQIRSGSLLSATARAMHRGGDPVLSVLQPTAKGRANNAELAATRGARLDRSGRWQHQADCPRLWRQSGFLRHQGDTWRWVNIYRLCDRSQIPGAAATIKVTHVYLLRAYRMCEVWVNLKPIRGPGCDTFDTRKKASQSRSI